MTEGKCTFGTRAPIDIHMLNEIIYREVKHFRNYKIYRPNFGCEYRRTEVQNHVLNPWEQVVGSLCEFLSSSPESDLGPFDVNRLAPYYMGLKQTSSIPVTGKFYASHDQLKAETKEETKKVQDYHDNVAQTRAKGPRSKYDSPATENQVYGWYDKPLVPMNRNDNRFYYPQVESKHTKIEIVILMCNPRNKKE